MSLREAYAQPGLPASHYFFSVSRGDAIRTFMLSPAAMWTIAALAALLVTWAATATAYLAFHDDLMQAVAARQTAIVKDYEDRLAASRARLDEAASRQLLDRNAFEGKMREFLSRQASLEQRSSIVAALAAEAPERGVTSVQSRQPAALAMPSSALGAIEALSPQSPIGSVDSAARAYAPSLGVIIEHKSPKPRPITEPGENPGPVTEGSESPGTTSLTATAADSALDTTARLDVIGRSLDRMESAQMTALAAIDRSATRSSARAGAIVAETGLDPAKLLPPEARGGVGGPYIPASIEPSASPFDRALARVASDVATAHRLRALIPFLPVREPLAGEAGVSSPFGYRPDPFLGRLALHSGVDLIQAYGADIHSTAAGRVVHAGPMGGYGTMVEIDHGNGLTTRYAHMSNVLVEEGQEVAEGAVLGRVGTSGRSTGPHLHYEVRVDGEPVDPERFLRAGAELSAAE